MAATKDQTARDSIEHGIDSFVDHQDLWGRMTQYVGLKKNPLLSGDSGVGKTTVVEQLAAACFPGRELITTAVSALTVSDLYGRRTLEGGETVWREGPITDAVRNNLPLYLDELHLFPESCLALLQPVLDRRRTLFLPQTGESIKADPGWCVFASYNPRKGSLSIDSGFSIVRMKHIGPVVPLMSYMILTHELTTALFFTVLALVSLEHLHLISSPFPVTHSFRFAQHPFFAVRSLSTLIDQLSCRCLWMPRL